MASDYEVEAELVLNAKKAKKEADAFARKVKKVENELERTRKKGLAALNQLGSMFSRMGGFLLGARSGVGRLFTGLVAVGGTYLGVRMVSGAIRTIGGFSIEANSAVETLTLSLGTLMSEIEGMTFEQARLSARGLYRQIQDIAIESPGTAREVADVFTMAYGPMRRAGLAMNDILEMSRDTLSVASALRIDLPQVSRDIGMMATGVAGTDVRTFRLLRSMGLITETTREWNEMALRTPLKAAEKLRIIMANLGGPAAEAFSRTWAGATSSFADLVENFARIFTGPTFEVVKRALIGVNVFLLRYRANFEALFSKMGIMVSRLFSDVIHLGNKSFQWMIRNLDRIALGIDHTIARIASVLPMVRRIAVGFAAFTVATRVLGPLIMGVGALISGLSGLGSLAGMLGIGGGAVAAGGTAVAGGAAGAGLAAILAPIATAVGILLPIVVAVGAGMAAMWVALQRFGPMVTAMFAPIWDDFIAVGDSMLAFFSGLWTFISPIIEFIGSLLIGVFGLSLKTSSTGLRVFSAALRVAGVFLTWVGTRIRPLFELMSKNVISLSARLVVLMGSFTRLSALIERIGGNGGGGTVVAGQTFGDMLAAARAAWNDTAVPSPQESQAGAPDAAPSARPQTNIDMRGSRINVNQDLRGEDPDRVWMAFEDGVAREAVRRTQSGFTPALTR